MQKKEYVIYNKEKNQSIENNPEKTQMTELADKDIKTLIINIFHMFKKLKKKVNMLRNKIYKFSN